MQMIPCEILVALSPAKFACVSVCNSWLLSIIVPEIISLPTESVLEIYISIPTDVVEFYMRALNCFIFSHHHDAGTFVHHNICLYIHTYALRDNKIWWWKGLCVNDSHTYHLAIFIHIAYRNINLYRIHIMDLLVWKHYTFYTNSVLVHWYQYNRYIYQFLT